MEAALTARPSLGRSWHIFAAFRKLLLKYLGLKETASGCRTCAFDVTSVRLQIVFDSVLTLVCFSACPIVLFFVLVFFSRTCTEVNGYSI